MISEGSCDAEDCRNDTKKFSFAITEINYILGGGGMQMIWFHKALVIDQSLTNRNAILYHTIIAMQAFSLVL